MTDPDPSLFDRFRNFPTERQLLWIVTICAAGALVLAVLDWFGVYVGMGR